MPGGWTMSMMWMAMPGYTWTGSAAMFLLMWLVMMVAMMLPSALPMLLKIRQSTGHFEMPALVAAAGFFFVWMVIGAVVYGAGVWYAMETMRMDWLSRITPLLSGAVLILCGVVQFTPWKLTKLRQCRAPDCGMLQKGGAVAGGWRYGVKQGMACCLCCAGPMLAMLVLGAMNLMVMVAVSGVIAAEKLLPWPQKVVRVFGVVALLVGVGIVGRSLAGLD